eukprot:TRINITY_DN2024_c0_g4_i1.p1 TRINITY_DN2024_c0_g4~~TRINITY_DN2024_c0_g4_i1.p1  ORF type:complete len:953 (-),score=125.93 TRINITY_DN2024_c0_g4_i1:132-2801(-)
MCGAGAWCLRASLRCYAVGASCNWGKCGGGAACSSVDNRCYETCYNTATTCGDAIPRKSKYSCDYSSHGGRPSCGVTNAQCSGRGDDYPCPQFAQTAEPTLPPDSAYIERSLVAEDGNDIGNPISPLSSVEDCKQRCSKNFNCNSFDLCSDGCWFRKKAVTLLDATSRDVLAVNVRGCKTFVKGARYYRWRITAAAPIGSVFCANELEMHSAAGDLLPPTSSLASSQFSGSTAPSKLYDQDRQSGYFCTTPNEQQGTTEWVRFDMGKPVWVQEYTLWSRQYWEAMPSAWVFESSSNETGPWTELDVQMYVAQGNLPGSSPEQHVGTYVLNQAAIITTTATATTRTTATVTGTITSRTATSTTSTITTFTWTVSADAVTGSFMLEVQNATLFVTSPGAELAARQAVAAVAGVELFLVTVSLRLQNSRRLPGRSVQAVGVLVDYSIAVPSVDASAAVALTIRSRDLVEVNKAFQVAVDETGLPPELRTIGVQVVAEPGLMLGSDTTSSASPPEAVSDSRLTVIIIAVVAGSVVLLGVVGTVVACFIVKHKRPTPQEETNSNVVNIVIPEDAIAGDDAAPDSSLRDAAVEVTVVEGGEEEDVPALLRSESGRIRGWELQAVANGSHTFGILGSLLHVPDPRHLGVGKDVRERAKYTKLTIRAAWRIQAPVRKARYRVEMEEIESHMKLLKSLGLNVPSVPTILDSQAELLGVDQATNEKVLLHGTKPELLLSILQNGLNERYTSVGLFGLGLYLAEDPSKTDQYCTADTADHSDLDELHDMLYAKAGIEHPARAGESQVFYKLVCRALLGYPAITKDGECSIHDPTKLIYATFDKRECADIPGSSPSIPHHSLIVEKGPVSEGYIVVRHREFVQFHAQRVLPEYLIAYTRDR